MLLLKAVSFFSRTLLLILAVWIISCGSLYAQHLGFKRYTVDDGLVQSEVVSIFQDSRGFIWAGTKFGVSRFDGHAFVTRFDSIGVLKSMIRFIEEFKDGSVFTSSTSGYAIFRTGGQLTAFRYPVFDSKSTILSWKQEGRVFVLFDRNPEINIIEATLKGPINVTAAFSKLVAVLKRFEIRNLCFDEKYNCFYFTDMNQQTYSYAQETLTRLNIPPCYQYTKGQDGNVYMLSTINRKNIKELSDSVIADYRYISSNGYDHGLFKLKGSQIEQVVEMHSSKPSSLRWANVSPSGKIIIPDTDDGNLHYDDHGKRTVAKLAFDGLSSLYTDDAGTLWLGTANGLIHVYPEYFINFSAAEGLFANAQTILAEPSGKIWVGSYELGLQYFRNGRFYKKEIGNLSKKNLPVCFYPGGNSDHLGRMHFCVSPYCEIIGDGQKLHLNANWPIGSAFYFYDDTTNGKYFYGSDIGLVEQQYGQQKFKAYAVFPGNSDASRIVSIVRAASGELLLGGFRGLLVYDGNRFEKLPDAKYPDMPGANTMQKDRKGNIWIGNGNGIYLYDNKTFRKIKNDYFNDLVLSLKILDSGKLLIGGIGGLGILDLDEFYRSQKISIRYFDKNNGFIGGECQQNCIALNRDGDCWIGASNGMVKLDVAAIPFEISAPRVYLTNVFINNEHLDWKPLPVNDFSEGKIKLSHLDNNIRFEFTGIYFTSPENLKFSYKLEGFDLNWSIPDPDRDVSYTNLPPGNYIFKVRACSDSGVCSEKTAEFRIFATAALWQTWYFYLFIMVVFTAIAIIGISHFLARRTRIIRERSEEERRFAELQFKTLRNQLAPHFIFNALNAIGSSIYQNDKEKSYDFLQRFATLIRSTLIHADKTYRTLNEEIAFVRNYLDLEQFRFENKFNYTMILQEGIDPDIPVPKMIIQTFAENAVKHGLIQKTGKGFLKILVNSEPEGLKIIVEDDGIGRLESMKYNTNSTGKGMEIIKEFISLFNSFNEKKIQFEVHDVFSSAGVLSGTSVTILLPVDFTYNSLTTTK